MNCNTGNCCRPARLNIFAQRIYRNICPVYWHWSITSKYQYLDLNAPVLQPITFDDGDLLEGSSHTSRCGTWTGYIGGTRRAVAESVTVTPMILIKGSRRMSYKIILFYLHDLWCTHVRSMHCTSISKSFKKFTSFCL
jgi:hypothetical protein